MGKKDMRGEFSYVCTIVFYLVGVQTAFEAVCPLSGLLCCSMVYTRTSDDFFGILLLAKQQFDSCAATLAGRQTDITATTRPFPHPHRRIAAFVANLAVAVAMVFNEAYAAS